MVSELNMPTVVVLHEGNVDPAPLVIESGISTPSIVLGFTDTPQSLNPFNSKIGAATNNADQLLIQDSVYERYSVDCSEAVLGIRSGKRPIEVKIFNVGSGVFHLLFGISSEISPQELITYSADIPDDLEVRWPE